MESGMITLYMDVLLRFSNIKEVFCGIWWSRCRIQKFRNSPIGELQGKYNIGEDCLSWSRRLGVTGRDEIDHLEFLSAIIARTLRCATLLQHM